MRPVPRLAALFAFALSGLACAGRSEPVEDPDLAPYQLAVEEEPPVFEPDEVIGEPDAPGADLIGEKHHGPQGPTQHVEIEDEGSPEDQVVAQPKREKPGSFMGGIGLNPNK